MNPSEIDEIVTATLNDDSNLATEIEIREQIQAATRSFKDSDADGSGTLDLNEIRKLCENMGLPVEQEEEEVLMKLDKDGSGTLELEEWARWWVRRISRMPNPAKQQEAIARNLFNKFDKDGSGFLDIAEFYLLIEALGASFSPEEQAEAVRELDKDGSGQIELEEFLQWWNERNATNRQATSLVALKLKRLARKASQIYSSDIFTAVWNGDDDLLKSFLEAEPRLAQSIDESEYGGCWTPLHYAAYQNNEKILTRLLNTIKDDRGINARNALGFTPLFYACQQYHTEVVKQLVERGADPSIPGRSEFDESIVLCPLDFIDDQPELKLIFGGSRQYRPPLSIDCNRTIKDIETQGSTVTFTLVERDSKNKSIRLIGSFPVKKVYITLSDDNNKGSETWKTVVSPKIVVFQEDRPRSVTFTVDTKWIRQRMEQRTNSNDTTLNLSMVIEVEDGLETRSSQSDKIPISLTPQLGKEVARSVKEEGSLKSPPGYNP